MVAFDGKMIQDREVEAHEVAAGLVVKQGKTLLGIQRS
jgi:hypothetical protein